MESSIRLAEPRDLPALVAIYNAAIPGRMATAETEPVTVGQREEWFASFDPASRPLWILETQDGVVAWLSLRSFYGRPAYRHTVEIGIYVAPGHQRQGHAGRLLSHAISEAPRLGIKTVLAFLFAHNEASVALFARHGFAGWGKLPRVAELDGVERDLLIMGRRVD